jgi:hypothetical protein
MEPEVIERKQKFLYPGIMLKVNNFLLAKVYILLINMYIYEGGREEGKEGGREKEGKREGERERKREGERGCTKMLA